ncbi:unnamed protein product [Cunninghamella blakesleeana]
MVSIRNIYTMKNEYLRCVRRSPGKESVTTRISCIQKMINNLKKRSLADKTFVSASSKSNESLFLRDTVIEQEIMDNLEHCAETTQGRK